jgi:flagellar basal body rod protein FlgG
LTKENNYGIIVQKMKKLIILLIFSQRLFSQDFSNDLLPFDEYMILMDDLANSNTNGYKSHLLDIDINKNIFEPRVTRNFNFSQGSLLFTNRELDFAIVGEGFFKLILSDGRIAYTRNGEFMIDEKTNELITINGRHRLYDTIKIELGYSQLFCIDNSIITLYPDGNEINNGILNIYNLDTNDLVSTDGVIFFYNRNDENVENSKIIHRFIEQSNVFKIGTQVRLLIISKILGMKFEIIE